MASGPTDTVHYPPSLSEFEISPAAYLETHKGEVDYLVAGAIVASEARILLIQRSHHDFAPLFWEIPGGVCEPDDTSILQAACRELLEEAGLKARAVTHQLMSKHEWVDDGGKTWRKFTFMVDVGQAGNNYREIPVKLDPEEHEDYVWASEHELQLGSSSGRALVFISEDQRRVVLEAFRILNNRG